MEGLKKLKIDDVVFKFDVDLEKYTTIKLAGIGSIAIASSETGLKKLILALSSLAQKYRLIGWGANQVLLNTKDTLFIKLNFPFSKDIFTIKKTEFELPASTPLNQLTSIATKFGFKGWEVFTGIPASLGGAICMNAGTSLGEIGDLIKSVRIMGGDGKIKNYLCDESSFCYRRNNFLEAGDIIVSAIVQHKGLDDSLREKIENYLDYRKKSQPLTTKNCGSVFKNNPCFPAGKTIDLLGLKGFGLENLIVSFKHGNFIENLNKASASEFDKMVQLLNREMENYSGQRFELEVKIY